MEAGWPGTLTLAILIAALLAIGHWLGGPVGENRTALAVACATRHIGIAVLAATAVPGPRAAVIVIAYILTASAVLIPYLGWRRLSQASDDQP